MRWGIGKRVFIALSVFSLIIVGLNAAATRWSFQRGFVDYLAAQEVERLQEVVDALGDHYSAHGSWDLLRGNRRLWDDMFRLGSQGGGPPPRDRRPPPRGAPPESIDLLPRIALLDHNQDIVMGRIDRREQAKRIELFHDGQLSGTLLIASRPQLTGAIDVSFATEQTRSSLSIGAAMLILAGLLAALFTRQLVRPIKALAKSTRALTNGRFEERITVVRDDEFGDLAADFNQLAQSLEKNQQSRRQWVSNISHELRTPLAILSGELQAIEDGLRVFDDHSRASLQAEVRRLSKLVDDLHDLTVSDEGGATFRRDIVNIGNLVDDCLQAFDARIEAAGLTSEFLVPQFELYVTGDSRRLEQLFSNVLENAVRYTDAPGSLRVRITADSDNVHVDVSDSAPGVAPRELDRLFERLYRVDASRNRATGGSGLGLAICETIVKAHDGSISAAGSDLGGVAIQIALPRENVVETST